MTEAEVREAVLATIEGWTFEVLLPEQKDGTQIVMQITMTDKMCVNFTNEVMDRLTGLTTVHIGP